MNKHEGWRSLGEFQSGSNGGESQESDNPEQQRQEAENQKFDLLIVELREGQRGELAAYLEPLSLAQRERITSELNMINGRLNWVQSEQQEKEAIEILKRVEQARQSEKKDEQMKAREELSDFLGKI